MIRKIQNNTELKDDHNSLYMSKEDGKPVFYKAELNNYLTSSRALKATEILKWS